jgi:hypothetical protein
MPIPQQAIFDAWYDMKPEIEKTFTTEPWPPPSIIYPETHVIKHDDDRRGVHAVFWLEQLTILDFDGLSLEPATFDASNVLLPISFSILRVNGHYRLTEDRGVTPEFVELRGQVVETVSKSSLIYHANNGDLLTLTGVSIPGSVHMEIDPKIQPSGFPLGHSDREYAILRARAWMPETMPGKFLAEHLQWPMIEALKKLVDGLVVT